MAFLSVLPDMSGFGSSLTKGVGKQADQSGRKIGGRYGKAILAGVAVVGAGALAAGKALYSVGETFSEVTNTIRVGTGATGKDLDSLVDSAKSVGRNVPAEFGAISESISTFNTLTGATGETLEELTSATMEASRMLGEDGVANSEAFGQAMKQWQIPAEEGPGQMDMLFKATQNYGVGLGEISGHLTTYGSVLQNAGFDMQESTDLFGQLEASGLDVSRVMPGLNSAFRNWAGEGKNSREEFGKTVDSMKDAGSETEALTIATDAFGAEGAQRLTTAVRSGAVSLDDLGESLEGAEGLIGEAGEETMTFSERWMMFKNNIMADIEPAATALFDAIGDGMEWISETGVPALKEFGEWLQKNKEWLIPVATAVGAVVAAITTAIVVAKLWAVAQAALNLVMSLNPLSLIVIAIAAFVAAIVIAWKNSETFRNVVTAAWEGIKTAASAVWAFLRDKVFEPLKLAWAAVAVWFSEKIEDIKAGWERFKLRLQVIWNWINANVFDLIKQAFGVVKDFFKNRIADIVGFWEDFKAGLRRIWNWINDKVFNPLKAAFGVVKDWFSDRIEDIKGYWDNLKNNLKAGYDWIKSNVFNKFRDGLSWLGDKVNDAKNRIGDLWDSVKQKFATPINWVIDNVWNKGIKRVFQAVVDVIPGLNVTIPSVGLIGSGGGYGSSGGGFTGAGVQSREKGGPFGKGWVLAGEAGPELIKMNGSGYVYTAAETDRMLASQSNPIQQQFSESNPPHGGPTVGTNEWFLRKAAGVGDWVLGGLATAAELVLKPVRSALSAGAGGGQFGELLSGTSTWGMDEAIKWLKKEDEKGISLDTGGRELRGAKPHVNAAAHAIADAIQPGMGMQAYNQSMQGAHGIGLAVDFLASGAGKLQETADFMVANHKRLNGLWEVIYNHKMWTKGRGWRPLSGGRGNDPGHVWHVHGGWGGAGKYDNGGWLLPGQVGHNQSSKPEPVFSASQWEVLKQNLPGGGGGSGGASYNAYITTETGATDESIADSVLYGMRRLNRGGVHAGR